LAFAVLVVVVVVAEVGRRPAGMHLLSLAEMETFSIHAGAVCAPRLFAAETSRRRRRQIGRCRGHQPGRPADDNLVPRVALPSSSAGGDGAGSEQLRTSRTSPFVKRDGDRDREPVLRVCLRDCVATKINEQIRLALFRALVAAAGGWGSCKLFSSNDNHNRNNGPFVCGKRARSDAPIHHDD
jgi:hypothetical protein